MMQTTPSTFHSWPTVPFTECLDTLGFVKPPKILAREYKKTGGIAVIDQGQEMIAGWTDDETAAIRDRLPFIVFGDHTRIFKFVDFPFALGADGTQLLKPKAIFNPRFFYYACLNLALPNRGYNRHFSLLKERELPQPSIPEQERIAAVLRKVEQALDVQEKLVATNRELKQSALRQLFTSGLRGESQKETDIGPVPDSWDVIPIRAKAKLIAGGTPSRTVGAYWTAGTIPWVKTGQVDYCVVTETEEKITPAGLKNSAAKLLPKGTLLIAMYGQGITRAKVAMLGIDAATNQACAGIIPKTDDVLPTFLYYYLTFAYEKLRALSHGAQQQNLNAELINGFPFPLPRDGRDQSDIVDILQTIDRKISVHQRRRATLQELFKTLLHQLMTGQIRVDSLDIDVSDVTRNGE